MKSFKILIIIMLVIFIFVAIFPISCTNQDLYLEDVATITEATTTPTTEITIEITTKPTIEITTEIMAKPTTETMTEAMTENPTEEPSEETETNDTATVPSGHSSTETTYPNRTEIALAYKNAIPSIWGDNIPGVITILPTEEKLIALTFDACGGKYDEELIEFLIDNNIPATLFITGKWIADNPGRLEYLSAQNNFQIENHGFLHMPLSVTGRSAYNIIGTSSPEEVFDEVQKSAQLIEEITGRRPKFFRSGTAFYDDIAVNIVNDLGMSIAGFTIAADGGATFSESQILAVCSNPKPGSILLFHMNRPEGKTFEGVKSLYAILSEKKYSFVKMEDKYNMIGGGL